MDLKNNVSSCAALVEAHLAHPRGDLCCSFGARAKWTVLRAANIMRRQPWSTLKQDQLERARLSVGEAGALWGPGLPRVPTRN